VDSSGSGKGPVADCCGCGDEPFHSGTMELVRNLLLNNFQLLLSLFR
jgi:hypothetical protein